MEASDGRDEAEAKSVAGRATAPFKPEKTLKHILMLVGGNSRSVVGNLDHGIAIPLIDLNRHLAGVAAMFDGVIDKIGERLK